MFQIFFDQVIVRHADLGWDPILYQIGPLAIRWYGLAYLFGILLALGYVRLMLRRPPAPMTKDVLDDFLFWVVIGVVAGGRLGYMLFYNFQASLEDPLSILRVWEGGMSFHGGLLGCLVATIFVARRSSVSILRAGDYFLCAYPLGHFLGRLANFINGELWGRPTDGTWGMIFEGGGEIARHPSQLYAAGLEGLLLFVILALLFWGTRVYLRPGFLTGAFLVLMGLLRSVVEVFREPDAHIGFLFGEVTAGQLLSLPMIVIGLVLLVTARSAQTRG